ncbi:MAG: NUDIX domain-containing protein [Chlamydiae bacterium]|nr:NUDIX domain-containing protein [Chlamydiota bacterium]
MEKHFTATAYILKEGKTLLVFHKKLQKWLPPGGHVEVDELPNECAIREAKEETGLDVKILPQENLWLHFANASSFERPYLCLLEEIPAFGNTLAHKHIDMIYITTPCAGKEDEILLSEGKIRWFNQEELSHLKPEIEIYTETLTTLVHLFEQFKH